MHKHHHIQDTLSLKWIIKHPLNKFPQVTVYAVDESEDSTPKKIHPQKIEFVDTGEVHVSFPQLRKGFVFLT